VEIANLHSRIAEVAATAGFQIADDRPLRVTAALP
jgi:hypothetical protein